MKVEKITEAQIRQENREYNPSIWDDKITRYAKYEDCQFYIVKKDEVYQYDRYFVTYKLPDGLILFKDVSYHSSLSNFGFTRVFIHPETGEVMTHGFGEDKKSRISNTPEGRKWMIENLCKHGVIVTTTL